MRSLQYFFYEVQSTGQRVLHDFGTDRVGAFTTHRLFEVQGKTLGVVQTKKMNTASRPTGMRARSSGVAQIERGKAALQQTV